MLGLIKRLYWDLLDPHERKYYRYELIRQVPGLFGAMLRARWVRRHCAEAGANLRVYAGARFRSIENLSLGDNVEIGIDCFIQAFGGVRLGDGAALAPGVKIWSVNHNVRSREVPVQQQGQSAAPVELGRDVFVGMNGIVLPGTHLPDGVVVTAGSVVAPRAFREYAILAGNPARVIGNRE